MVERPRVGVTGNARRWAPSWWCTWLTLRLAGAAPERISVRHPPSGRALDALIIGGGDHQSTLARPAARQRHGDNGGLRGGKVRVYYGVTEDGLHGEWKAMLGLNGDDDGDHGHDH